MWLQKIRFVSCSFPQRTSSRKWWGCFIFNDTNCLLFPTNYLRPSWAWYVCDVLPALNKLLLNDRNSKMTGTTIFAVNTCSVDVFHLCSEKSWQFSFVHNEKISKKWPHYVISLGVCGEKKSFPAGRGRRVDQRRNGLFI